MTVEWLQPSALAALAAIAGPVVVHLLRRQQATRVPFASLRFVDASRAAALRMRAPSDPLLLLIRMAIIAAAALAWAQPALISAGRQAGGPSAVARAIVIDTSASMQPVSATAREAAAVERTGARITVELAVADVREGLRQARVSLEEARTARREVVVISDFQVGTLDEGDLAEIPAGVAIRLVPLRGTSPTRMTLPASPTVLTASGVDGTAQTIAIEGAATRVTLRRVTRSGAEPRYLAAAAQAPAVERLRRTLATANAPGLAEGKAVAFVFPGASVGAETSPPREPWMREAIVRMRLDPMLGSAVRGLTAMAERDDSGAVAVFVDGRDRPLVEAASAGSELVIRMSMDPSEYAAAATAYAVMRALSPRTVPTESEVESIPTALLQRWSRTAPEEPRHVRPDPPGDARVLWAVVLVLFALEMLVRRRPAVSRTEDLRRAA